MGHTINWNNVFQYHIAKTGKARFFWPEVESNSTFIKGGAAKGDIASFITPGMIVGRFPLSHQADGKPGQLGFTVGAGEQIVLTKYRTYNHATILTFRVPF